LSTASIVKAVEAGIDRVDTAIGSMSMTYGHSATNSVVSILENSPRKTGAGVAPYSPFKMPADSLVMVL
jgi:oxaloacetate decarboxylase alpha subunit